MNPTRFLRTALLCLMPLLGNAVTPLIATAQPSIQSINPSQGPIAGGTQVTLAGTGFTGATLTLDGTAVEPRSASDTQIVFQTPAHDNGIITTIAGDGTAGFSGAGDGIPLCASATSQLNPVCECRVPGEPGSTISTSATARG